MKDGHQTPGSNAGLEKGLRVGQKYVLVRPLDEGGMGTLWVAHNEDLDMHVALKLIRADAHSSESAERLLKEARILARLDHPAIVRVFDVGRLASGDPFIVMELLNGECLADSMQRQGRTDTRRAVQLLLPIADALGLAHSRGIVHRDLKPENVFLAQPSFGRVQPKVLDFGIARLTESKGQRLTNAGALLGSPAYMSPEQARGDNDVDLRADVWAYCVVLYELATGRAPFIAENYNATLRAIIEQPPVPMHELAAGDAALWAIVERGLAKDPSARHASMRELGSQLADWLFSHGVNEDVTRASLHSIWLSPERLDDAPVSIPPVSIPPSGAPPSLRRIPETPTMRREPAAEELALVGGFPRGADAGPRPADARRLSTGGHGAVSLTADGRVRWRRKRAVVGLGVVVATGLIGLGALRLERAPNAEPSSRAPSAESPPPGEPLRVPPAEPAPRAEHVPRAAASQPAKAEQKPVIAEPPVESRATEPAAAGKARRAAPERAPAARKRKTDAPPPSVEPKPATAGEPFRPREL